MQHTECSTGTSLNSAQWWAQLPKLIWFRSTSIDENCVTWTVAPATTTKASRCSDTEMLFEIMWLWSRILSLMTCVCRVSVWTTESRLTPYLQNSMSNSNWIVCFPFAPLHTHSSSIFLTFSSLFRSPCVCGCANFPMPSIKFYRFLFLHTHIHPSPPIHSLPLAQSIQLNAIFFFSWCIIGALSCF